VVLDEMAAPVLEFMGTHIFSSPPPHSMIIVIYIKTWEMYVVSFLVMCVQQRMTCRNRSGEGNTMDLEHLRSLTANHLLKLFSEFDGDEIRRIFTFTCSMEPDRCREQFSSFGSEGKARQQMKSHLLEHVHLLELKAERKYVTKLMFVSIFVRRFQYQGPPLVEFLAANPEVPGSIPGATRFSE
jgi:hypothetical protein